MPTGLQSPRAKLVCLYLSTTEKATITELHEQLDMKKISLYSILKTLQKRGVVSKDADSYVLSNDAS
ncbi:helix-turn-helix domain-containing protein [Halalkalirubrum salinum]|uniref:helix-turn-helix domain-containing protein n=1 Tax=Halalkalirubrum salinum TaxID=2563889 RepID=UPI001F0D5331|nr:helix-turn-helix domain-containing protein [Halalkalirubrum salinum]